MSDLTALYAGLRGAITQTGPVDPKPCTHPRRQQRIERTSEPVPGSTRYSHYLVRVTTEIHCDGCNTIVGHETHQERRSS